MRRTFPGRSLHAFAPLLALLLATRIDAQHPSAAAPTLRPGQALRVWLTGRRLEFVEGELAAIDSATLVLRRMSVMRGTDRALPMDSVRRLDVRVRRGRRADGAWKGAGVGAVSALALAAAHQRWGDDPYKELGTYLIVVYGTPILAGAGALIGAAGAPGERWVRVR